MRMVLGASVGIQEVHTRQHVFRFEPSTGNPLRGRLLLDDAERELLTRQIEDEDDSWYLDDEGERLPSARLFEGSPWSCPGPAGSVKLLHWSDSHGHRAPIR